MDVEKLKRLRVAVLCGGPGPEREVSLASGDCVYQALAGEGMAAEKAVVPESAPEAHLAGLACDVAVMMLHGDFGEDGQAQRIFEKRGIPFTGSTSEVCELAMDKDRTKRLLAGIGVPTAKWCVFASPAEAMDSMGREGLTLPVVVKPNAKGSSVGVSMVRKRDDLAGAVEKALEMDRTAMIEEMIEGREITVGWLDGRVLPIIELVPDAVFYDYEAKYLSDRTRYIYPAELGGELTARVGEITRLAAAAVKVRDLARVDLMVGKNGPMVLEINTLPGFTTHSLLPKAAARDGLPIGKLCLKLVEMAAKRGGLAD